MSKNSIQVGIKVRPLLKPKERDMFSMWQVKDNSIHMVETQTEPYFFDYIFDQDASNEIIFEKMAKQIVHACVQGFNGTIFAYGQTSSGKTYTMMGDEQNPGVMVLAAKEIFKQIEENSDRQFLLRVGYIEIYNEKIYDLLNKKNQDLKIHEAPNGIVQVNCEERIITSEKDLMNHLCYGNKVRTVGETNMNERSSRSHAIFRIIIESRKTDRSKDDAVIQSVLNLVDLAGSERADQTGATGTRLKEGGHINKSLMFLSNVIKHLSENADSKYVSYRDSKLTRILQASLGGNALTSIICTIKPTTVEETQSTLNFAMRAKVIKNKPQLNEIVTDATMMKRLESEIKNLKGQLDAERRKNASQIKVGELEKRLQAGMLKIISGDTLNNLRIQSDKRRRTWCPAISTAEASQSMIVAPSSLPMPTGGSNRSQLPKPNFSSTHISTRDYAPKTISVFKTLDVTVEEPDDYDFSPAEEHDFSKVPTGFHTPKALVAGNRLPTVSLTPTLNQQPEKNLEVVEKELLELQKYTNLEKQINVQHEQYASLKKKLDIVSSERDVLKSERLSYIQVKDELDDTKLNYQECEKRCDVLQIQISKLTNSNQLANEKISRYEVDLESLKLTNAALEKENREAVSLDVEFEQYRKKSTQRIDDLLSALSEKDREIIKLEESLRAIAEQSLHNSKEEQFQASMLENGNINSNSTETFESICVKCENLERLREENIKVSADFLKLTLEYEKLKESYNDMSTNALAAQSKLQELKLSTSAESAECEELRSEIVSIRAKLVDLQLSYEEMNCDRNEKSDTCEKLNSILERARADMQQLQTKYDNLELVLAEQNQTIKEIQAEYNVIKLKYDDLQTEYDKMEENTISSYENCQRLQSDNTRLITEIGVLKARVEEEQRKLLALEAEKQQLPEVSAQLDDIRQKNASLTIELNMMQSQYYELQKEYNDLSNQLMDSIQESDALRVKCLKLEDEKSKQIKTQTPTPPPLKGTSVSDLRFCDYESMKSSGVGTESSELELDFEILQQFIDLSESIQEIELEIENGSTRVFKNKSLTTSIQPSRKLYIRQVQEIVRNETADCQMSYGGKLCMQGILRHNPFHIIEIENDDDCTEEEELSPSAELKTYIADLEREIEEKNQLLETTEGVIKEMRVQMTNLESELLEKSVIVERVGDYQRQIECLEKEKLEITMVCEELQEKVKEVTMSESLIRTESTETLSDTIHMESMEAEVVSRNQQMEFETKLNNLQAKLDEEMQNLLEKNNLIEKLQDDLRSMTTDKTALEQKNYNLQSQLVEQENKAKADAELITKLREGTAELKKLCHEAEAFKEQCDQQILQLKSELDEKALALQRKVELVAELEKKAEHFYGTQEFEKQLSAAVKEKLEKQLSEVNEELLNARNQIKSNVKEHKNELSRVNLELLEKLEFSESEYRKNLQKYNHDWEESRDSYEKKLADSELKLMKSNEQKQKDASEYQVRIESLQSEHAMLMVEIQKEKYELESTNEGHRKLVEKLQNELLQFESTESENIKELKDKCSSLELEKENALVKVIAWRQKYDQQIKDYADLKTETDQCLATLKAEKSALESTLEDCRIQLANLQEKSVNVADLQLANEQMTASLESLRTDYEHQTTQLIAYETLKAEFEKLLAKNQELRNTVHTNKVEKMKVDENVETLELKIESLRTELEDAKQKMSDYETLVNKHDQNEISLKNMKKLTEQLECDLAELKHSENVGKTELNQLRNEMLQLQEKHESECMKKEELLQECKLLKEQKLEGECALEKLNKEMLSKINEMQANCDKLKGDNLKLEAAYAQLNAQLKAASDRTEECEKLFQRFKAEHSDCVTLREALEEIQLKHNDLKELMVATVQEADNSRKELQAKLSKVENSLKESTEEYKAKLETMEEKTKSLNDTISGLRKEKKEYDERATVFESIIKSMDAEPSLSRRKNENTPNDNTSFDSNNSMTSSPLTRKSLDRVLVDSKPLNSLNINVDDKLIKKYEMNSVQENERRRNRRLSTHDERRQQSYIPKLCDKGVMTESTPEKKCECDELKTKVQDYEFKLYLSEGQVKRLRLDLKNHPLKEENFSLKKRFEDLKYKTSDEIDRLREKISHLSSKVNKLSAEAESTEPEKIRVLTDKEAQTDSDLEGAYNKLQGKYNDLVNVCRHRYNTIKDLQNKLHQLKDNTDSGNMNATSYEVGRLKSLETENDLLKKDLQSCNQKLESAKIVLTMRRKEIEELNDKLGIQNNCDSPL